MSEKLKAGFAMCASCCTYQKALETAERLAEEYELYPLMSEQALRIDSRFGKAEEIRERLEAISGKRIWRTVEEAEPIGPKKLLDVLIVCPCTGGTLGKLARGITDNGVTMAVKAQLRNERPVVLAIATNDGLSGSAEGIGQLLNRRDVYFVPYGQDDPHGKPRSLIADFSQTEETVRLALLGRQIQPLLLR